MSVLDLSTVTQKSIGKIKHDSFVFPHKILFPDDLYEVFVLVDGTEYYDSPSSVMDDLDTIIKVVKIMGFRYRIKYPEIKPKVVVDKNAYKR